MCGKEIFKSLKKKKKAPDNYEDYIKHIYNTYLFY